MQQHRVFGIASLSFAAFLYGFFPILSRLVGFDIPIFYLSVVRNVAISAVLIVLIVIFKTWTTVFTKDWRWIIARSLAGLVGFFGAFIAFYYMPIGIAYFINYAAIVIGGYIFGWIFFKEQFTKIKIIALFFALIGLTLIYSINYKIEYIYYSLWVIISGFGTALWSILSKKISSTYSAFQLNFIDSIISTVVVLIVSILIKETWVMPTPTTVWFANLGFVAMFVCTGTLVVYGFKYLEAQIGSLIMLLEVLFGILFANLFFSEIISLPTLIGGMFILLAVILPQLRLNNIKSSQ